MSEHNLNRKNLAVARLFSFGSYLPGSGLVNGSSAPNHVPTRWHVARETVDDIDGWTRIPGDLKSGPIPRLYKMAGVLSMDAESLDELNEHVEAVQREARQAVAYKLGDAVMVGVMPEGQQFRRQRDRYEVAMRIGPGALEATAGLWVQGDQALLVPDSGINVEQRLHVTEVPRDIPLF